MTYQVVVSLNLLAICIFFWEECSREKSFPHTSGSLWAKVVETFCHFLQQAHAVEQPQQTQPPEKSAWFSKKQAPSWGGTPVTGTCEIFLFCFVFESPICNLNQITWYVKIETWQFSFVQFLSPWWLRLNLLNLIFRDMVDV